MSRDKRRHLSTGAGDHDDSRDPDIESETQTLDTLAARDAAADTDSTDVQRVSSRSARRHAVGLLVDAGLSDSAKLKTPWGRSDVPRRAN